MSAIVTSTFLLLLPKMMVRWFSAGFGKRFIDEANEFSLIPVVLV